MKRKARRRKCPESGFSSIELVVILQHETMRELNSKFYGGTGIFLTDFCPVREDIGGDGAAGTADDACGGIEACTAPGSPASDNPVIDGFSRRIAITEIDDPVRPFPDYPIRRRRIDDARFAESSAVWKSVFPGNPAYRVPA